MHTKIIVNIAKKNIEKFLVEENIYLKYKEFILMYYTAPIDVTLHVTLPV
jgi:hypothetical protein